MRKYRQCGECGRIKVRRGRWLLPLEAVTRKKVKPNKVVKIPECPKCLKKKREEQTMRVLQQTGILPD